MNRIGIVGCGLMGSGIAEVVARSGGQVIVIEQDEHSVTRGRERISKSIERAVNSSKLSVEDAERVHSNIEISTDFSKLCDREIVIEAVAENESMKLDVFQRIDDTVIDSDALLASNTSSIPIIKLAMATSRPTQVIGMHFFNPVPVLHLVELIPSILTSPETMTRASSYATGMLDKKVILSQDRAGFVVNALLIPYILSAIRMVESGFASAEDIDTGMTIGCAHPMGPLALSDLIGLDTTLAVAESLYLEFKEPHFAPPPLLSRMTQAGLIGRKSGRGFFNYVP